MRIVKRLFGMALVAGLLTGIGLGVRAEEKKAKRSIEEIMDLAHGKDGILNRLKSGKASVADKKELLALYEDLAANKPPKGEPAAWKKRTTAIVVAAKDVVAGKTGAVAELGKATSCKACHTDHKPDE
jgi:hypothetical protein